MALWSSPGMNTCNCVSGCMPSSRHISLNTFRQGLFRIHELDELPPNGQVYSRRQDNGVLAPHPDCDELCGSFFHEENGSSEREHDLRAGLRSLQVSTDAFSCCASGRPFQHPDEPHCVPAPEPGVRTVLSRPVGNIGPKQACLCIRYARLW